MRKFNYFYFDSYSSEDVLNYYDDPRNILGSKSDEVISTITESIISGENSKEEICKKIGEDNLEKLIHIGVIKEEKETNRILFACPMFIKEDIPVLSRIFESDVDIIVDKIVENINEIKGIVDKINNGFDFESNLYNFICALIFDGMFFQYLVKNNILSTSRINKSGLDYIPIIYEKDDDLDSFSNELICSLNKFSNNSDIKLMSFGDANGDRQDFFRITRNLIINNFNTQKDILEELNEDLIINNLDVARFKNIVLDDAKFLIESQNLCENNELDIHNKINPITYKYLKKLEYMNDNNQFIVPIYIKEDINELTELEKLIESIIGKEFINALDNVNENLFALKNKVSLMEVKNELYHILFGKINQKLVDLNVVKKPEYNDGEGRYLKFITLF